MSLHYQYADMHCDTLLHGLGKGVNDIYDMPDAMLDIKRMAEANVLCQSFAVFFPPRPEMLTPQEREIAIKAARTMALDVAGVDILRANRGPLVMEVNASPGLEGVETTTGVDIASKMIAWIERQATPGFCLKMGG